MRLTGLPATGISRYTMKLEAGNILTGLTES